MRGRDAPLAFLPFPPVPLRYRLLGFLLVVANWRAARGIGGQPSNGGQSLLHHLDTGFTAIQWWDRCQGDTRGACNSTVLLEGKHTAEEMLAALREHFPHVLANLEKAGVKLVEVKL